MKLTINEERYYYRAILPKIKGLPKGMKLSPATLFDPDPTSPRLCRWLFRAVRKGEIPELQPIGNRSRDGYFVI